jgi:hypothetical protein
MLRFTGQNNALDQPGKRWGPMRFVYIQHASDPMTFFSPDLFLHRPDWLVGERGPDVSPYLRWCPIVTHQRPQRIWPQFFARQLHRCLDCSDRTARLDVGRHRAVEEVVCGGLVASANRKGALAKPVPHGHT